MRPRSDQVSERRNRLRLSIVVGSETLDFVATAYNRLERAAKRVVHLPSASKVRLSVQLQSQRDPARSAARHDRSPADLSMCPRAPPSDCRRLRESPVRRPIAYRRLAARVDDIQGDVR